MPPEKIVVGLPAYGIGWLTATTDLSIVPKAQWLGHFSYYDICAVTSNMTSVYDNHYHTQYTTNGSLWISYDDTRSLYAKVCLLVS